MVKKIVQLEGLVLFLLSLFFYNTASANWILFVILLFTPDISMIGYLKDKKIGAMVYNSIHNYMLAGILMLLGFAADYALLYEIGLILFAHVSLDRFIGFGLKYPSAFKDTHIQRL